MLVKLLNLWSRFASNMVEVATYALDSVEPPILYLINFTKLLLMNPEFQWFVVIMAGILIITLY